MTKAEIKSHIEKKAMPIAMPFMNQLMEEVQRADLNATQVIAPPSLDDRPGLTPAQQQHLREVQQLNEYKSHYEEETEKWWMGLTSPPRTPVYERLILPNATVIRGNIGGYISAARARKAQIINLFTAKKLTPLAYAKSEIEMAWKGVIPLCESELQKLDPDYKYSAARMPEAERQALQPYGGGLGAFGTSRNINTPVMAQRNLSGIDKLRGHGRPVLSEQQGTKGLAGLFPALRSSMQGALRQ